MQTVSLCTIAFFAASTVTYVNIYNSDKLHNYFFLIYKCPHLLIYCFIYGLAGLGLFLLLKNSVFKIDNNQTQIASQYLAALGVGISTKGVADINLFNIKYSGQTTPIGFKTISRQADLIFDNQIEPLCFERQMKFMKPFREKYRNTDLAQFKLKIVEALSSYPDKDKVAAFTAELNKAVSTKEVLDSILQEFGVRTLRTFNDTISV
jgi:hypothetical protein